jgi:membrane protease YdiL (CAAX protease family)
MRDELGNYRIGEFVAIFAAGVLTAVLGAVVASPFGALAVVIASLMAQQVGHLTAIFLIARSKGLRLDTLGLDVRPGDVRFAALGVALQIGLAIVFDPLTRWLIEDGPVQSLDPILRQADTTASRWALGLGIAFLAPVTEELMFRGVLLYRMVRTRGPMVGLIVSSIVFAVLHSASLGGDSAENMLRAAAVALPQLLLVGIVLGRQALRHGRLGPPIFTHIGFNLLAVVYLISGLTIGS